MPPNTFDDGVEYAALEAPVGKLGKEALDCIEPRARCRCKMECEAGMAVAPPANFGMFVRSIIVEDHMNRLVGRHTDIDGIEEADKLLMPVLLHIPPNHGSIENVKGCKQRGGAIALVIVGHRAEPSLFERQAWLAPVKRLNLALLIKRQHDGMRWRIDIQPNNIVEMSTYLGSFDSLNCWQRCGCRQCASQMRRTELELIPLAAAIKSAVQCIVSPGESVSVNAATRSITFFLRGAMRDGRDLSRTRQSTPVAISAPASSKHMSSICPSAA